MVEYNWWRWWLQARSCRTESLDSWSLDPACCGGRGHKETFSSLAERSQVHVFSHLWRTKLVDTPRAWHACTVCAPMLNIHVSSWVNNYVSHHSGCKVGNGTSIIMDYKTCPWDYCKEVIREARHSMWCGLLCGACATNYSLMLGSMSVLYLAPLLPFAAARIALVVFLSILRLPLEW